MTTCAICLNTVRETRQNKPIRCGHLFHSHCIEKWKERGNQTCPVCRKIFDGENFKVQVTIRNMLQERTSNLMVGDDFIFDVLDIFFDVSNVPDIESLLSDFGMSVSDFDTTVFDTE
jgi:hypothetical protein